MAQVAVHSEHAGRVADAVLTWYAANKRDLPWRYSRDPYAILVAEVMLQQTQVDRVIPRWRAWLERFPELTVLARASRADAVRAWQGLGYNLRAVRLHALAVEVVANHGGTLPTSVTGLLALKGIGRYTAGAVACFAHQQPVAMVDTNIRRVLGRVFQVAATDVDALADQVVPAHAAYAWNQALMDLGATLCRATRPLCLVCPLVEECRGPGLIGGSQAKSKGQFRGSRRFLRGRLVEALRGCPDGLSLHSLSVAVGRPDERERVVDLVHTLAAEGIFSIDSAQHVRLAD